MNLQRVTITGADDSTDIQQLLQLSLEFPFVEWGILVSKIAEGSVRFPSRVWIDKLVAAVSGRKLLLSTHICGRWVRDILYDRMSWEELPDIYKVSKRCQLNTHGEKQEVKKYWWEGLPTMYSREVRREYIFQLDGVNDYLALKAFDKNVNCSGLFDSSHGDGILPDRWPQAFESFWCGYAGGLSRYNLAENVNWIESVTNGPFWVDMETHVRTKDGAALDMEAVRDVLQIAKELIGDSNGASEDISV